MNDLWPDFFAETAEPNDALEIIRHHAVTLEKKTNKKVKATFSKISYRNEAMIEALGHFASLASNQELLENELNEKKDVNELYNKINYKFEIYNETYRFRVFVLEYRILYPIEIIVDEGIKSEISRSIKTTIYNNAELTDCISSIFSSRKLKDIILQMMK